MTTLHKSAWPKPLADLLKQVGYRKHHISYSIDREVTICQPYWSGGFRDDYFWLDLSGNRRHLGVTKATPWPQPPAEETFPVTPSTIAVCGGIFCGKPATWDLTIHPDTATAWGIGK